VGDMYCFCDDYEIIGVEPIGLPRRCKDHVIFWPYVLLFVLAAAVMGAVPYIAFKLHGGLP